MFSLDGRLWRTLPKLMLRPGRMTREYIDGKRSRYVPPFRLFLLTSVIFFVTMFWVLEHQPWMKELKFTPDSLPSGTLVLAGDTRVNLNGPADLETLKAQLDDPDLPPERRAELEEAVSQAEALATPTSLVFKPDGSIDRDALEQSVIESNPDMTPAELATAQAAAGRFANLYENQERFAARMKEWAPRFTLLFLPIFSFLLALSYAWHRKRYFYDHLITGLHFQTYVYVLITLMLALSALVPSAAPFAAGGTFLILFAYLMRMLRVTYDTGHIMSFLRTGFLLIAAVMVLSLLAVGLVILSFFLT
ncbi:DUF3667 domain-containing protein [Hyphomonas sp.]|uniref:DUF3667 domain-containing protein n=1 Tax=Hyphomonas sp. TaxID=87 RepID=UPI0025C54E4A|nr:DUF3667 domain-containing protein [Hyphomonas sp.]